MQYIFEKRNCLSKKELKAYLNGSLDTSSRQSIENHLLDCPLCSDTIEGLRQDGNLLNKLSDTFYYNPPATVTKEIKLDIQPAEYKGYWFRIAAGTLLLIGITALFYLYSNRTDNEKLFVDNFNPLPPVNSTVRGADTSSETDSISDVMILYGSKEYDKAIKLFKKNLELKPQDNESMLYLGICYLQTNQTDKSIDAFKRVRLNSEEYYNDAAWYLSLAYLKKGNISEAEDIFKELVKNESPFMDKAKELLTKISQ